MDDVPQALNQETLEVPRVSAWRRVGKAIVWIVLGIIACGVAIVGTPVLLGLLFLPMVAGFCTNSDGQLNWYTENDSCSYINYKSCSFIHEEIPARAVPGCSDEQKVARLHENPKLIGAPGDEFAEACRVGFQRLYEPAAWSSLYEGYPFVAELYEGQLAEFSLSWGIEGVAIAEACKPFVSEEMYTRAKMDRYLSPDPNCGSALDRTQRYLCKVQNASEVDQEPNEPILFELTDEFSFSLPSGGVAKNDAGFGITWESVWAGRVDLFIVTPDGGRLRAVIKNPSEPSRHSPIVYSLAKGDYVFLNEDTTVMVTHIDASGQKVSFKVDTR